MTEIESETQSADELPETIAPENEDRADPTDAFSVLGNEIRMAVLRALVDAEADGVDTLAFSELFEATSADNTAGFSYHLRQLTDHFIRKTERGYALTYAGREIARAIRAGTYTDSVDFDPIEVDDPCPFCREESFEARGEDNYVVIECSACDKPTLTLPFPPGGHRAHDRDGLLTAFDRHHRYRLSLMSDGVCPECSAPADARIGYFDSDTSSESKENSRPQVRFDCDRCGCRLRSPVTLAVLEHPEVISFYHRHDKDIRERPVWNVGEEWREAVVSEEPWCVRVSTELDGNLLSLFVAETLDVVTVQETTSSGAAS
ncbi:ArsR family transcriptional regulator [Haladaptatus pallidirubidus]|uniref:Winged helix-turn-helix domain-containing protein n=1 Tax=Haladaptatus pallidirubidus TaxID=1008152 RepID=A0AAV3UDI5_9EURY|nr:helix-turn-helix domain-containing protein [Haladaptatus pallidirubidus]